MENEGLEFEQSHPLTVWQLVHGRRHKLLRSNSSVLYKEPLASFLLMREIVHSSLR